MFLVNALQVLCGRRVIAVYSRLRSLKFAYVSSGSHGLAGQTFLFLSGFLFAPPISPVFFIYLHDKELSDKEQKKEGLQRRLAICMITIRFFIPILHVCPARLRDCTIN